MPLDHGVVDGTEATTVRIAQLWLVIDLGVWIEQAGDLVSIAFTHGADQLLIHEMLAVPEVRPGLDLALGTDQLELGIHVEILINVAVVLVLLNVLLNVMDAQVLVLLDIVQELHFIWCDGHGGPQPKFIRLNCLT